MLARLSLDDQKTIHGGLRLSIARHIPGWLGVFALPRGGTEEAPLHRNLTLGLVRRVAAALASFSRAATALVHCGGAFESSAGLWSACGPVCHTFTGNDVQHWAHKECVQDETAFELGYPAETMSAFLVCCCFEARPEEQ
jgi:hypothetical protein